MTKAFLPAMIKANHGHIVCLNSVLGLMGLPGAADYCASKHGLTAFMESLSMELATDGHDGIFTTSIHPYMIDTNMFNGVSLRYELPELLTVTSN
jgi:short-subunit dehydrogenase